MTNIGQSRSNVGLDAMTHFWCEVCDAIQPTFFEGAHSHDTTGEFAGGDIVCDECGFIIATAYAPNGSAITGSPIGESSA
jgi:hypothetical protein